MKPVTTELYFPKGNRHADKNIQLMPAITAQFLI